MHMDVLLGLAAMAATAGLTESGPVAKPVFDMATTTTAIFSVAAAVMSGLCAFGSFVLARRIYGQARLDERVVFGPLDHPVSVKNQKQRDAVVCCQVFNKSARKAYVNKVEAFDSTGKQIEVTWSSAVDAWGNPTEPTGLIGVVDASSLYVRRNDGELITDLRLSVYHSFCGSSPDEVVYEPFR